MPDLNKVIEVTTLADFNVPFDDHSKVLLVVLGNTPTHIKIKDRAHLNSEKWRFTVWAKDPSPLIDKLKALLTDQTLNFDPDPWPADVLAITLSKQSRTICSVIKTFSNNNVDLA